MTFTEHPHGYSIAVTHHHLIAVVRETLDGDYFWTVIPDTGGAPWDSGYQRTREAAEAAALEAVEEARAA